MHLITFLHHNQPRLGPRLGDAILDLNRANPALPTDMAAFLALGESALELARQTLASANTDAVIPLEQVALLAPVPRPGKILCIGHNYQGHIGIGKTELPEHPNFFCKTANVITGHQQPILVPRVTSQVDYEAELAVIIGKRGQPDTVYLTMSAPAMSKNAPANGFWANRLTPLARSARRWSQKMKCLTRTVLAWN